MRILVKHRPKVTPIITVLLCFAAFACKKEQRGSAPENRTPATLDAIASKVLPWIVDENSFLVSPDARQLLIKRDIGHGDFELTLESLDTRQPIGRYRGGCPLLITWRPDNKVVAFVADEKGDRNFRIHFWTPADGTVVTPNIPGMWSADRLMRWSPDGQYLAFRRSVRGKNQFEELWLVSSAGESAVIFTARSILDFRWSPGGTRLAVIDGDANGCMEILHVDAKTSRRIRVKDGDDLSRIAWLPPNDEVLVVCTKKGQEASCLYEVDLETGTVHEAASPKIGIIDVVCTKDGKYILTLANGTLLVGERGMQPRLLGFDEGVTTVLSIDEAKGEALVDHTGLTRPRSLHRIDLANNRDTLVHPQNSGSGPLPIKRSRVRLTAADGVNLPVNVWRTRAQHSRGVVIRFPTGRGAPYENYAGADQYLLQEGYDVIAFGLRQRSVSVGDRDDEVSEQDVADALAVIAYAHGELRAPPDGIVLTGGSFGTLLVARTAARMRDKRGGIVFVGITRRMQAIPPISSHSFRITLLQGENDGLSPMNAKDMVERVFGANTFNGRNGICRALAGEGHSPRQLFSRALITAAIHESLSPPAVMYGR
jgi:dipeptidyl aminopeptidase/acylaminoacyl peptidase